MMATLCLARQSLGLHLPPSSKPGNIPDMSSMLGMSFTVTGNLPFKFGGIMEHCGRAAEETEEALPCGCTGGTLVVTVMMVLFPVTLSILSVLYMEGSTTSSTCLLYPTLSPGWRILNTTGTCLSAFSADWRSEKYSTTTRSVTINTSALTVR